MKTYNLIYPDSDFPLWSDFVSCSIKRLVDSKVQPIYKSSSNSYPVPFFFHDGAVPNFFGNIRFFIGGLVTFSFPGLTIPLKRSLFQRLFRRWLWSYTVPFLLFLHSVLIAIKFIGLRCLNKFKKWCNSFHFVFVDALIFILFGFLISLRMSFRVLKLFSFLLI